MTRPEKAEALFRSGYNCAQSVVMAFAPDFGLTQEEAERISAAFGGGFSRLRETCGTVSGAAMVLSLRYGAGPAAIGRRKRVSTRPCRISPRRSPRSTARTSVASWLALGRGRIPPSPKRARTRITAAAPAQNMCVRPPSCSNAIYSRVRLPLPKAAGKSGGDAAAVRHSEGAKRPPPPRLLAALRPAPAFSKNKPPHKAGGVLTE